jgi:hypothetical protein
LFLSETGNAKPDEIDMLYELSKQIEGIMWPSLVKIQHTELKLSRENDPVVKNCIYSNGDLDLMTPK